MPSCIRTAPNPLNRVSIDKLIIKPSLPGPFCSLKEILVLTFAIIQHLHNTLSSTTAGVLASRVGWILVASDSSLFSSHQSLPIRCLSPRNGVYPVHDCNDFGHFPILLHLLNFRFNLSCHFHSRHPSASAKHSEHIWIRSVLLLFGRCF